MTQASPTSKRVSRPIARFVVAALIALAATALPGRVSAAPVYFPPTRAGWPGEVRDERDVTPYLAFHKAQSMALSGAMRTNRTPNQDSYDARYYSLDLYPNLTTQELSGTVRMVATVTAGPITTLDLNLYSRMVVDSVAVGAASTTFTFAGGLLTLNLGRAFATGEAVSVFVRYHGAPAEGVYGAVFAFDSHAGKPLLWTLSEPFGARGWWPCKDYPDDKVDSVDIRITVPSGMITASNGTCVSARDNGTTAVSQWHEGYPIATYLVSISSYAYETVSDWYRPSPADSMEIQFYLYPEDVAGASAVHARVKEMIGAFAARFGPYPFLREKYGEAESPLGGGMENQTITSLGNFNEYIVAHELAHAWWGDNVTFRDFHHVWLAEGFATYGEALWAEAGGGPAAYHSMMDGLRFFGPGTVWAPDETDLYRVFNAGLSYNKAAWVLHMLRHVVGDDTFFAAMRAYGSRYAGATATTEDFRGVVEQVSGMGLQRFFDEWIYGEYYPKYRSATSTVPAAGGGYDVKVLIRQTQSGPLFWMPVDVTVNTASGPRTFVARDSLASQWFTFHVSDMPLSVELDRDGWVLGPVRPTLAVKSQPPPALRLLPVRPNPSRAGASLSYWLPGESVAAMSLFDVTGARVRSWRAERSSAGAHTLSWDGRDDSGRPLPPGVYTACLDADGQRRTQRIVLLR